MSEPMFSTYFEIQRECQRTYPGHEASTRKAFELLPRLNDDARILDLACGAGAQALTLARLSRGTVTAVDADEPLLDELRTEADRSGLGDRVRPVLGPIDGSSLAPEKFDLVWSEGGARELGLGPALRMWRERLTVNGCLAFSDLVWLKGGPPLELASFLRATYPGMRAIPDSIDEFEKHGFDLISFFIASERAWWAEYLDPLERRVKELRPALQPDPEAVALLDNEQKKIDFRRRFPDFYGLVFFVARPYAH